MSNVKRIRIVAVLVIAMAFLTIATFPVAVRLLVDWHWFSAVGFQVVFTKTLLAKGILGLVAGVIALCTFYANFRIAQRGVVPDPIVVNINTRASNVDITRGLRLVSLPASILLAVLVGTSAMAQWDTILKFLYRTPFGVADPVFGRDVGYYLFSLPAIQSVLAFVQAMIVLSLFLALPLYVMRGDIILLRNRVTVEPASQRHIAILVGILFLATAATIFFVRIPSLVYSTTGPLVGASYSDLIARLPVLRVAGIIAVVCAAWVIFGAWRKELVKHLAGAAVAYFGVATLLGGLVPVAVQKLIVVPNELTKEAPQLQHYITASRKAWGLENVDVRQISGEASLTLEEVRANQGTIRNVRLWDREPLLDTFGQLQEIRTYYDFVSVDDDRYWINDEYRQVLLSLRELNTGLLPTPTFINERLTFTHGMGLTLAPVNQVTPEGLPELFVKDLPPVSNGSLNITRPEVYYGELSSDYVFVNTGQAEFDYPSGDSVATTTYEGTGGVRVGGFFGKLLLSARFQSLKIFLSDDIVDDSRVLFHRKVAERAAKALPFLMWDRDPYVVISESGRLKWILDAYTVTDRYPNSVSVARGASGAVNYMRNSVKVVIDAYDGDIHAFVSDSSDPIIQTYRRVYPGIFQSLDDMPDDLRAHVRYPEDLFRAQTQLYTVFHMNEPDVFYHREDQWQIPAATRRDATGDPFIRHIVMKLPGEAREEFILMTPFTPNQRDNLAAWMIARNDGDRYGELVVYRFPRQSLVFGPTQIANRIDQNTEISQQISLWDQQGSQVDRGNLLVIPIEEALLFVQALYLRAEGGRIPELKRVIVAYQNRVVMEETLEACLERLFGGSGGGQARPNEVATTPLNVSDVTPSQTEPGDQVGELVGRAAAAYDRAIAAQRAGDWTTYGRELETVGNLLRQLRAMGGGN